MYPQHYSPKAQVFLVKGIGKDQVGKVVSLASRLNVEERRVGILVKEENKDAYDSVVSPTDLYI